MIELLIISRDCLTIGFQLPHQHSKVVANLNDVLYKDRVVVPLSLRPRVLNKLHSAHQGETSMHARAQKISSGLGLTGHLINSRKVSKLQPKLSFSTIVNTRVI